MNLPPPYELITLPAFKASMSPSCEPGYGKHRDSMGYLSHLPQSYKDPLHQSTLLILTRNSQSQTPS